MESPTGPPLEVELKLHCDPGALADVLRHPALTPLRRGRARTETLVGRYYDTPEHGLRDAGVTLRLRSAGRRWVQTAKGAGTAIGGLHQRIEHEWPRPRPLLDRAVLATTPWEKLFAAAASELKPVFAAEIRRTSVPLQFADGTTATLCLDAGKITAGARRLPVSEIEIELVRGNPLRLYELGQAFAATLPVGVAHLSKAERGYALATTGALLPVRASRVPLPADASATAAMAAVGGDCLRQIGANVEGLRAGGGDEFVHQLRVGVRRLRSLLKFMVEVDPSAALAPLDAELQWLAGIAGAARDWDVLAAETLTHITPQLDDPRLRRDIGRLKARVTRRRRTLHAALVEAAGSTRTTRMLLALGALFTGMAAAGAAAPAPSARAVAASTLAQRDRQLRKRSKGLRELPPVERHRARLAAKKLRYAAEFFAPLYRRARAVRYIAALASLQAALGKLNDLATAQRLLDELPTAVTPSSSTAHMAGIVRGWCIAAAAADLERADKASRAFAKLKPFWQ